MRLRRSPIQLPTIRKQDEASFLILSLREELRKIADFKESLEKSLEEAIARAEAVVERTSRIQKGETGAQGPRGLSVKGDRGPKGEKGDRGEKGEDGVTPTIPIEEIVSRVTAQLMIPMDGKDGKDAVFDYEELKKRVQKELGKVKVEDIEGLNPALEKMLKNYGAYIHGGGDTVAAGTNVTITTNSAGSKVISAASGSGSWSTPPETPNGSTTVFTVAATPPTDVVADGIQFYDGVGYTYAGSQITFDNPPTQYVRYR